MKFTTKADWLNKASNFQNRIAKNPYPKNLNHYINALKKVKYIGDTCLDVGCGAGYLGEAIDELFEGEKTVIGLDPFPRNYKTKKGKAEDLINGWGKSIETVFCFAALDNCENLTLALEGLKKTATKNIVILTGIGIEPDNLHTVRVDREDLMVLGNLVTEIEISKHVYLFEFNV